MRKIWDLLPAVLSLTSLLPALNAAWNPDLAASYIDSRQQQWLAWKSAEAPGGPCISCHTGVINLLARPMLPGSSQAEKTLLDGVKSRLLSGEQQNMFPTFTSDKLKPPAISVDAVISAFVLTNTRPASQQLSEIERRAFDRLWSLQLRDGAEAGAWTWFSLSLDPWESESSAYYGAALAAMAAGSAPRSYREEPAVKPRIDALLQYLKSAYATQTMHNKLALLWASAKFPAAMETKTKNDLIAEIWSRQQPDGGWTSQYLGPWTPKPDKPQDSSSNAYATALSVFALQQGGASCSAAPMKRAIEWLASHQDPATGAWRAPSLNKTFAPASMMFNFMDDASTGLAVMALSGRCK